MLRVEALQVAEEEVVESSSSKLSDIYSFVSKGSFPETMNPLRRKNLRRYAQKFILHEAKLYYVGAKKQEKREVVIDSEQKRKIFLDCHFNDMGHHLGQKKTVYRIQSHYYWLGIIKDVVDWIKVCETCQQTEMNKNLARTVRPIRVDEPWDLVGVDFTGPFPESQQGSTGAVLLLDYFSKWPEVFPVRKMDALSVARCLCRSIYRFGAPKNMVCAQRADFCEEVTKLLSDRWSIVQKISPLVLPQLNPLHDCTAPLLKDALVQMVEEKQDQWEDFLDPVLFLFRTSTNPTTKFTPYSLMFNRRAHLPNQTNVSKMTDEDQETELNSTEEKASTCLTLIQEQQSSIKEMVAANMNAAYKQEKKKSAKRRTQNTTFRKTEPLFAARDSRPPKKLRDSLYLTFPVGALLSSEQNGSDSMKTDFRFN